MVSQKALSESIFERQTPIFISWPEFIYTSKKYRPPGVMGWSPITVLKELPSLTVTRTGLRYSFTNSDSSELSVSRRWSSSEFSMVFVTLQSLYETAYVLNFSSHLKSSKKRQSDLAQISEHFRAKYACRLNLIEHRFTLTSLKSNKFKLAAHCHKLLFYG